MMQPINGGEQSQQQWMQSQPLPQGQPPQQWMAVQYPAAAMAMQQQFLYAQQYMAYQQQHQQQSQAEEINPQQSQTDGNRTLWVGDLHHWMDESYLHTCFAPTGQVVSVKVIRNKQTGHPEGYGFVEFYTQQAAENVLQTCNGSLMPNAEQPFRLNWASFGGGDRRSDVTSDLSIFVGDLASDVTDAILQETFASVYSSVKGAKVVMDSNTGRSKGYGFVRFSDESERTKAMTEMNGAYCLSRPMRIGVATPRKQPGYSSQGLSNGNTFQSSQNDGDCTNTTVFVGGLDPEVTEDELRQAFSSCGEIISTKIPLGKGCGFVQFANRSCAEEALQVMNGTLLGKQTVRLSWGRNQANRMARATLEGQWNGGYYYGGQGYTGYGYGAPQAQDAAMYAANGAYGTAANGC